MSSSPAPAKSAYAPPPKRVLFDDDDEEEREAQMASDNREKKPEWKNNLFVPLGIFGGACALGAGFVLARRNAGWNMSQTIMQARVAAQGVAVAGLVGMGAYAAMNRK